MLPNLVNDQLKPWNRRCKTREDDAHGRRPENRFKAVVHGTLERRVSRVFVGSTDGKKSQYSVVAVGRQSMEVEQLSIDGCGIDLEVSCVDNGACRRLYSEGESIHDRMRYLK